MDNSDLIQFVYNLATDGIRNDWFQNTKSTAWYDYVAALPEKLRTTYLITVLNMQVTNGGFNQYFVNGYGQFSYNTIEALRSIGSLDIAELLQEALKEVNKENLNQDKFRQQLLSGEIIRLYDDEALDNILLKLDDKFYELQESMELKLANYLKDKIGDK